MGRQLFRCGGDELTTPQVPPPRVLLLVMAANPGCLLSHCRCLSKLVEVLGVTPGHLPVLSSCIQERTLTLGPHCCLPKLVKVLGVT